MKRLRNNKCQLECGIVDTMQKFSNFLESPAGENTLLFNNLNVKHTYHKVDENGFTHLIFKDDQLLKELAKENIFHIFESISLRPVIKDCEQLITVMIQKNGKVRFMHFK